MPTTTYFRIRNKELLVKSLMRDSNGKIGSVIQEHVQEFGGYFKEEGLSITGTKNYLNKIFNNEDSFSEGVYNAFLCTLFDGYLAVDSPESKHRLEDFKKFYQSIKPPNERLSDEKRGKYNMVIKRIIKQRPYFEEYELNMNSQWRLLPTVSKTLIKRVKKNRNWILLVTTVLIGLISLGYWNYQNNTELNALEKEKNLIEKAKLIRSSRTPQLTSIYDAIGRELNNDYNDDGKRNISPELIGRIISLSNNLEPYLYFRDGKLINEALSPERAELFLNIFRSDLDSKSLYKIIKQSNFTYSDFYGKDLSGLNLIDGIYGIEGHYKHEIQIFLTPFKMGNFSYSDFSYTNLDNTTLFGNFKNCDFSKSHGRDVLFFWSNLEHTNFEGSNLEDCKFESNTMNHANFKKTKLSGGYFDYTFGFFNCDLRGVVFDESTISGGRKPFTFENCFFSSLGTFYTYSLDNNWARTLHLNSFPYIDGSDNYAPLNAYEIVNVNGEYGTPLPDHQMTSDDYYELQRFIDKRGKQAENIRLNDNFKIFKSNDYDEDKLWRDIVGVAYLGEGGELYSYTVRTNDNLDRSFKAIRYFDTFFGQTWSNSTAKKDTLFVRSSFGKLQSEYADIIHNHRPNRDTLYDGISSFKNCLFRKTKFQNSSMELVSFEGSKFIKRREEIENEFSKVRLKKNNFKISSGIFKFSNNTQFDSLYIDNSFPLMVYSRGMDSLIGELYNKRMNLGTPYDASHHLNIYEKERDSILKWVEFKKNYTEIDTTDYRKGEYLLKVTQDNN